MKRRTGYTLVELLVVAVLAISLLGIAAAGYHTWVRSTSADASRTLLLAELERARAYALARCCATRVSVYTGDRGDALLSERLDSEKGEDWIPLARTNRLAWTHVALRHLYFRPDGSCCTNEDLLTSEAVFEDFSIELYGPPRSSTAGAEEAESQTVTVSARTGLAKGEEHP
ncbi:MAG: hypothetical protein IJQ73_04045 [Kiritimatiellae bacterium]|nr:hypothetical protein [Kiritimatiellia bacterium]